MINRTILVGRLTADPTLRYTPSGTAVCSFTLAVGRAFKKDETDFIQVIAWKKQAENVANFVHKGSLVGIDGRIQTRNYEKDGKKVYVTEVVADSVQFLEPKREQSAPQNTAPQQNNGDPFANDGQVINVSDDDLPF